MIILGLVIWYIIGWISFVYWWTKKYHFKSNDVFFSLFMAIAGPVTFLTGWYIFGDDFFRDDIILFKQREDNDDTSKS